MKTFSTTEHTDDTERAIRNYELEITNNKCNLLRRNFWERQHPAGIYFNVAQASCLCLFLLKTQARRLYHTLLIRNIGYMIRFAKEYPLLSILPQPAAPLTEAKKSRNKSEDVLHYNTLSSGLSVDKISWLPLTYFKNTVIFALTIPAKPLTSGHAQIGGLLFLGGKCVL